MLRATSILLSLAVATGIAAQTPTAWLGEADIKQSFSGVEIDGVYVDGMKFTESYDATGAIVYRDTRKALIGRWSVVNGAFCTLYEGAITGGCFKVVKVSANCFEFYFLADSEEESATPDPGRPKWIARGWNKKHAATCDDKPLV